MSLRMERFELRAFGPFTATTLELQGARSGDLHIICGPNEVGKSTAQRGIGDFFFGIPPRTTDNQIHDYVDLRLAAVLVDDHRRQHELVRRKGTRQTLLDRNGESVDEALLDAMLGGMNREVFESMFSITHESLVIGGKALLAADGNLGESLFSASLGAAGLHELRAELEREAGDLFRPRATSSVLLQCRAAFETAQTELREATLRATTFTDHERELRATRVQREALVGVIRQARSEQNARERMRRVVPLLAAREQAVQELDRLADAAELPPDARDRRLLAMQRAVIDRQSAAEAGARVVELERRIADLTPDAAVLERELAIKDLNGRLANVREGAGDLERQKIKLETARGLARRALVQVRPDLNIDRAGQLCLTDPQRARIDGALDRHSKLTALLDGAEQSVQRAETRCGELCVKLNGLQAPPDSSALEAAASDAQAHGQLEQRIAEVASELVDAVDLLDGALRDLEPAADIDALRKLRAPSSVAVEQFADCFEQLENEARDIAERREGLDRDDRALREERARLTLGTNVPTLEDLGSAREARDDEWQRLRRRLEGAAQTAASPDVFAGHLRHADDVADRLRAEADSVARNTQLTVQARRLSDERLLLVEREQQLADSRGEHQRVWEQTWASTGIAPASPREMLDWLRVRQAVLERADLVARRERSLEAAQRTRDGQIETLREQLSAIGQTTVGLSTLSSLLAMAQTQAATSRSAREQHDQLGRDLQTAQATAADQRENADELREALTGWHQEWATIVAASSWPADIGADSARQVLATVTELAVQLQEASQLNARVSGIQDRLNAFERDTAPLTSALAPSLQSWPTQDAVAELQHQLDDALQARSSQATLTGELDAAHGDLETARRSVQQAERELEALIELAGVRTIDELPEAERRSARTAELHIRIPELEREIAQAGQALLSELIHRAELVDIDALDAQRTESEDELARLEEQLRLLDVRIGELGVEQQKMEQLGGAADAAEKVEQRVAELREHAERYVRLHVAAWALSEAIDAYRHEHKAPLLKRADELFPKLTRDRFLSLEVSFDEADEPVLVGVRATGEKVTVNRMSTGTREQLYLALRLASLERHVELHGPMPVILDDVVLHSDPRRKSAILGALADLGRSTQVIAFTHDPQVVALAQNAVDPDLLTVHELGGNEITGALQPQIAAADVRPIRPAKAA
ncbi:MAG: AAA family ATPase [Solirubrobacteraceae bacterium]